MKKCYLFLYLIFICTIATDIGLSQTTVFEDDFSTNNSATYTTSGAISSSSWNVSRLGNDWGARRNTSPTQLELTNDVGATSNATGWIYAYVSLSAFISPFNSTLKSNTSLLTWSFNMRTNRTSALAGFSNTTSYGMAFVLVSTSFTPSTTGSGYAVVVGGGSSNNIALISFNNGLQGTRSTIIGYGNTPAALTDYLSIKVTYDPSSDTWAIYSRDDGATGFADPLSGTLTQIGANTANSTYTSTSMSYMGAYWQGSTGAGQTSFFDNVKVSVLSSSGLTPPTLTADVTDNNVDHNIDIPFTDDAAWRSAITAVKVGGTTLTNNTDYVISAGNIQLIPSGGNSLLKTAGSKTVTVEATGYNTASVTQLINAGAPTANSTATINSALGTGGTSTITCTAKDQYNNLVSGYTFKYDVTINNSDLTNGETYTIDGASITSSTNDVSLVTATNASGVTTFPVVIPSIVDAGDGLSILVQLNDGSTNVGTAFNYVKASPQITFTGADPGSGDFSKSSSNNILYKIAAAVINDNTTLSRVDFITSGTYISSDISANGFKLWYSTTGTLSGAIQLGTGISSSSTGTGEVISFTGLSQTFSIGTAYLLITADLTANSGRTVAAQVTSNSDLTFSGSPTYGSSSFSAGNLHNIAGTIFSENFDYSAGTGLTTIGWSVISSGTNKCNVSDIGLTYNNYPNSNIGRACSISGASNSEDIGKSFTQQTSGTVYYSFMVSINNNGTGEGYFTGLQAAVGSSFNLRIFSNGTSAPYKFGLGTSTASYATTPTTFDAGSVALVVLKYTIGGNAALYVFKDGIPQNEPASPEVLLSSITSFNPGAVFIRQDGSSMTGSIDGLRIATSWGDSPLPVELSTFTSSVINNAVALSWSTVAEKSNYGFNVERSADKTNWVKIGFVNGSGNSNSVKNYSFTDKSANSGKMYYRLKQVDTDGKYEYSKTIEVDLGLPKVYELSNNYPNPFNPSTTIRFSLPEKQNVKITVFNTLGQKVAEILNGEMEAGVHEVNFNASNLTSGIYICKMNAGNFTQTKKLMLVK
jgi:hypothetical protein